VEARAKQIFFAAERECKIFYSPEVAVRSYIYGTVIAAVGNNKHDTEHLLNTDPVTVSSAKAQRCAKHDISLTHLWADMHHLEISTQLAQLS